MPPPLDGENYTSDEDYIEGMFNHNGQFHDCGDGGARYTLCQDCEDSGMIYKMSPDSLGARILQSEMPSDLLTNSEPETSQRNTHE